MQPSRKVTVTISNRTIIRTLLWLFLAILAYHFIGRIAHALTLIFGAFFLAMAMNPVVGWMGRELRIKSRVRAALAAYLTVMVVLAAFLALIIPPLVGQTRDFIREIPTTVSNFQSQDTSLARAAKRYHLDAKLSQGAKNFARHYSNFGGTILNTGKRVLEAVVSVLVVLILAFMMLVEGPRWLELLWGNVAEKDKPRYQRIANRTYRAVTNFVNGQLILAVVAGAFALVALEIASHLFNVSINAVALAGIVAVLGIIPLFGNPSAALIVISVCLLNSVALGLVMLTYFIIYFFIENHTFQPYLQSRLNELTPLTVLVAAIIGVGFGGFLGALVAIPVASSVKIILEEHFGGQRKVSPLQNVYEE